MRYLRTSIHLSARAARRAKPAAAFRASIPAFSTESPSQRFLASISRQAAALHTTAPASALLEAAKSGASGSIVGEAQVLPLAGVEESEESEESNSGIELRNKHPLPPGMIDGTVQRVVEQFVECDGTEKWRSIELASPSLKFKIVRGSMVACEKAISNVDLTNIMTVADLLDVLHGRRKEKVFNPYSKTDAVEQMFQERGAQMPPNLYFLPRQAPPART